MEPVTIGLLGIVLVFLLLFLGMPIALSCMFVGLAGIAYLASLEAAMPVLASTVYEVFAFYPYTVIPLFILMGGFCTSSGMTANLFTTFDKWLGRLPGGLGLATIAACAGFAAVSGSSVASAAAMGTIAIPEMRRFHYDPKLAAGCVAAGGTLAFLIPPSIGFIVYGMLTEQSIGKLLVSGLLPGLLLAALYAATVYVWVRLNPKLAPASPEPVSFAEKIKAVKGVAGALSLFLLVIGGIYLGFFTATEAAAVGATVMFLWVLAAGKVNYRQLVASLLDATRISAMVLFLVAGASVFSYFLALSTIPTQVAAWASELTISRYVILLVVVGIYLFLGCLLDSISMMVLTMPVIFPVMTALDFHPIWFGVISVLMMEAGLITPPMGLNVFTVAGVMPDVPLETIFKGSLPFLFAIIAVCVIITIFPQVALVLPLMMGR
ncbi:MAG: TRAP transporter large permease [Desulfarculus sp.]|nr:TRAP transporter large permease [Desulfarculus sp.]